MRVDAAANRERILAAAEDVFGAEGAAGSTEEVARRAGVGIATVFRHFPTKAELVEATLLRHFAVLADEAVEHAARDDAGPALFALIRHMIADGATKLRLASLLPDGSPPPAVRAASNRVRRTVATLLARAVDDGDVRTDVSVDEVYLLVRALAEASATTPPRRATLERAVEVLVDGIRA